VERSTCGSDQAVFEVGAEMNPASSTVIDLTELVYDRKAASVCYRSVKGMSGEPLFRIREHV
jgi:hypothetical protein